MNYLPFEGQVTAVDISKQLFFPKVLYTEIKDLWIC